MIGAKIVKIERLSEELAEENGWNDNSHSCAVIHLDDGTVLFPSQDAEGNGPGALFGSKTDEKGEVIDFIVWPEE